MRTSDLNRRVTIQQRDAVIDGVGSQAVTWSNVATVWAGIAEASAREVLAAQAMQTAITHKVTIRYQPQFADPKAMAALRVKLVKDDITRVFNIRGSHDDGERRRYLVLDAEEGLNDG